MKILFLGYGNPGRGDDGIGPAFIDLIESLSWDNVSTDSDYQLNIEYAADFAEYDIVVFVDASVSADEPFTFTEIAPSDEISHTTHSMSPQSLIGLAHEILNTPPAAYLLEIRGYEFDFVEGLTQSARNNMLSALRFADVFVHDIKKSQDE